jgi:SurA-like N-terminal domain
VTATTTRRRQSRWSRTAQGLLLAVLVALALSGCTTTMSPGVAASVDGKSISQKQVDSVVQAACAYTAASSAGQTPTKVSLANLRAAITSALVQFAVIDKAATAMKLSVDQAAITQNASQNTIPPGLKPSDKLALQGFFYQVGKSTAQTQLIGAHLADPKVTTIQQVKSDNTKLASKYLSSYVGKQDVRVNPSYGRWNGSTVVGGSGSLSEPVSALAKVSQNAAASSQASTAELPSSQVC